MSRASSSAPSSPSSPSSACPPAISTVRQLPSLPCASPRACRASPRSAASTSTRRGPRYRRRARPWHGVSGSASIACLAITPEAREIVDEIAAREAATDRDDDVQRRRHRGKAGGVPRLDLALADEEELAPNILAHVG